MMHYLTITLFFYFLAISLCRPPNFNELNENEEKEAEYDEEEQAVAEDEDLPLSKQSAVYAEQEDESQSSMTGDGKVYNMEAPENDERRSRADEVNNYKLKKYRDSKNEDPINHSDDYQAVPEERQANSYIEGSDTIDQGETSQQFINRDVDSNNKNHYKNGRNEVYKIKSPPQEANNEKESYVKDNQDTQMCNNDPKEYNIDADSNEKPHNYKQFITDKNANENPNNLRDRRQTLETNEKDSPYSPVGEKKSFEDTIRDEEAAIKRHIKKLSVDELEGLLSSLSDDKRALLNKIIESDHSTMDGINKREITKKDGAIEENSCIENPVSDSNKIQEASPSINLSEDSLAPSSNTTNNITQSDNQTGNADISTTKIFDSDDNNSELVRANEDTDAVKSDLKWNDNKNVQTVESSAQSVPKNNIKRETNSNDLSKPEIKFDDTNNDFIESDSDEGNDSYFCNQEEDLSQLADVTADKYNEGGQIKKRELLDNQMDVDGEMKSLEESFPNSHAYENSGQYSESDMVPLIRVKRNNKDAVKKSVPAPILHDNKVAYVPYRTENDDEDNEEGNEFDDDCFYDRTSNIANINEHNKLNKDMVEGKSCLESKTSVSNLSRNENLNRDTLALGSDTDNVLAGVGVDENLMINDVSKAKRSPDGSPVDVKLNRPARSTPLIEDEMKSISDNYINMNVPNYQSNDAFGPLPKNYETELSRFKRIRRVKQSPTEELSSSNS